MLDKVTRRDSVHQCPDDMHPSSADLPQWLSLAEPTHGSQRDGVRTDPALQAESGAGGAGGGLEEGSGIQEIPMKKRRDVTSLVWPQFEYVGLGRARTQEQECVFWS